MINKFFKIILINKKRFNLNSIMLIINLIDLIDDIKNKEKFNKIIYDFSKETNDIYQKIISYNWNENL